MAHNIISKNVEKLKKSTNIALFYEKFMIKLLKSKNFNLIVWDHWMNMIEKKYNSYYYNKNISKNEYLFIIEHFKSDWIIVNTSSPCIILNFLINSIEISISKEPNTIKTNIIYNNKHDYSSFDSYLLTYLGTIYGYNCEINNKNLLIIPSSFCNFKTIVIHGLKMLLLKMNTVQDISIYYNLLTTIMHMFNHWIPKIMPIVEHISVLLRFVNN